MQGKQWLNLDTALNKGVSISSGTKIWTASGAFRHYRRKICWTRIAAATARATLPAPRHADIVNQAVSATVARFANPAPHWQQWT